MQQSLATTLGAYNLSVTADATKIKAFLNRAQQYVCGDYLWPFLIDYEIVQTVTDITTGTVSVNAADTALTFSSGPAASVANRYIKFSSADDWYKITAHTAASTSATISPAYGQTTNLSAGTFTIRKLLYTTTTPFTTYLDMKKTVNPGRLESVNRREGDFFLPLYLDPGDPLTYIMGPLDSSGNLQFSLANPPDSVLNLNIRGIKTLSDMSLDADTSIIPSKWHGAVLNIAAFYGFQSLNDSRATTEFEAGEAEIAKMRRVYSPDAGRQRVMGSPDETQAGFGPVYTLPSNYGRTYYP